MLNEQTLWLIKREQGEAPLSLSFTCLRPERASWTEMKTEFEVVTQPAMGTLHDHIFRLQIFVGVAEQEFRLNGLLSQVHTDSTPLYSPAEDCMAEFWLVMHTDNDFPNLPLQRTVKSFKIPYHTCIICVGLHDTTNAVKDPIPSTITQESRKNTRVMFHPTYWDSNQLIRVWRQGLHKHMIPDIC